MADDSYDDASTHVGPVETVRHALTIYKRITKARRDGYYAKNLRNIKRLLEVGLAWSDQKGPRLEPDQEREARTAVKAIATELETLKAKAKVGVRSKPKRGSVQELEARLKKLTAKSTANTPAQKKPKR